MEDERVTLRLGSDVLRAMDAFLDVRPELGSRSLFIRNLVRDCINRDADASAQDPSKGMSVELPGVLARAISKLVEAGEYLTAEEFVRTALTEKLRSGDPASPEAKAMAYARDPVYGV